MKQKVSQLTDKERAWIAVQLESASKFVDAFSPADARQTLALPALDRAFAVWLGTQEADNQVVNAAINFVGVAFGQFLVDGVGLAWVIATDFGRFQMQHHFPTAP